MILSTSSTISPASSRFPWLKRISAMLMRALRVMVMSLEHETDFLYVSIAFSKSPVRSRTVPHRCRASASRFCLLGRCSSRISEAFFKWVIASRLRNSSDASFPAFIEYSTALSQASPLRKCIARNALAPASLPVLPSRMFPISLCSSLLLSVNSESYATSLISI